MQHTVLLSPHALPPPFPRWKHAVRPHAFQPRLPTASTRPRPHTLTPPDHYFPVSRRLVGGVDCVFLCPGLQHAGLAFNRLAVLPPSEVLSRSQLLSLDVAHNDLEGLMVGQGRWMDKGAGWGGGLCLWAGSAWLPCGPSVKKTT